MKLLIIDPKKIVLYAMVALCSIGISSLALAGTPAELYQQYCISCHGATGAGDGPHAGRDGHAAPRSFTESARERTAIEKAMLQGVDAVPGHGIAPLLTSDEVDALINHVHGLANPQ